MDTNDLENLVVRCNKLKAFCELCVNKTNKPRLRITYTDSSAPRPTSKTCGIDECDTSIMLSDIRKFVESRIEEVEKQIKLVANG